MRVSFSPVSALRANLKDFYDSVAQKVTTTTTNADAAGFFFAILALKRVYMTKSLQSVCAAVRSMELEAAVLGVWAPIS